MKKITLLCIAFIAFAFSFQANAQCDYTLEMNDSWGDGWNGGTVDVLVNGSVVLDEATFTSGAQASLIISVNDGDQITTMHSVDGDYPTEMSYRILDNIGVEVGTGNPTTDIDTAIDVICQVVPDPPLCTGSPTPSVGGTNTGLGSTVDLSWIPDGTGGAPSEYEVFFGTTSGALTSLGTTTDEFVLITGLEYDTMYYWMIVPSNAGGVATGCTEWNFMSISAPPTPTNDTCNTGIAVSCGSQVVGSTADAAATNTGGNDAADLWYVYSNPGVTEDVTFSLCNSDYDTNMIVYSDCPATTQIVTNDDFCALQSEVTVTNTGTETFYIMVEGYDTSTGDFILTTTCSVSIPAPSNDNCDASETLTLGVSTTGTTAGATDQGTGSDDDTDCDPFDTHADVWYSITLTGGPNELTVTTTPTGTSNEAGLAIYPDECDFLDVNALGCAGSNSDTGGTITLTDLADGTYYVRVWSDGAVPVSPTASRTEGTFDIIADVTLSTADINANGLAFTYYPNPVSSALTLKAQKDIDNVSVYNMLGQEVLRTAPNAVDTEISMENLQSGAYFVKVTIGGVTETVRVLKN
ncbi:T9SS type A sorting domain-containing protein [Oceanihabitans sp. 2_MG-2023]|uniref:T9SS type A sorting domain-containing protein n=1 Tax=Oceanihabitans sp. 2_MG-2023 TaxID=3062661 RepID=UPI0026E3B6D4|nr:T9SS type A sorting domain-containing protein [Oceanihabitans sp. 2_MG-2023]MDO6597188.1 T9SS type A sorting domain-containing protein [Oceanihabitans sp. 2_MG-2023]